jgi:REP element-mobilizing transposase RayT
LEFAGAVYHVVSRGNARQRIFYSDRDRQRFLRQLRDNLTTYDVVLFAYVLMPNHFHLLLQTRRANLSRFMQRLNSSYALYFRFKHHAPGHVFQGRYRAKLIDANEYLVPLSRYIHLNPARGAAKRKEMAAAVGMLQQYVWSSYAGYVRKNAAEDWICYEVLRQFGAREADARRHYRAYLHAGLTEDDRSLRRVLHASRYAIGSADYVRRVEVRLRQQRTGTPRDRDVSFPRPTVDLETIDAAVARAFGVQPAELRRHGRHAGEAKAVAMELACRLTELNQRQIGTHYGGITSMAVCMSRRRFRETADPKYANVRRRCGEIQRLLTDGIA